jgi:hypothetical protein
MSLKVLGIAITLLVAPSLAEACPPSTSASAAPSLAANSKATPAADFSAARKKKKRSQVGQPGGPKATTPGTTKAGAGKGTTGTGQQGGSGNE